MKLVNIVVKINNEMAPYYYKGVARKHKDIIEYDVKDENFVFDKAMERIVKSTNKEIVTVDFKNKLIIIKSNDNEIKIDINIIKKEIEDNNYYYLYEIDKTKIELILELEE